MTPSRVFLATVLLAALSGTALAEPANRSDAPNLSRMMAPAGCTHVNLGTTTTTVTDATSGKAKCFAFGSAVVVTAFDKATVCFTQTLESSVGSQAGGQTNHTTLTDSLAPTGLTTTGNCFGQTLPQNGTHDMLLDFDVWRDGRFPGQRTALCSGYIKAAGGLWVHPPCRVGHSDCATNGAGGSCAEATEAQVKLSCMFAQGAALNSATDAQLCVER